MRGNTAIAAALDLGLQVEREEGTDTIRLRSAKIRDFAVEPFAARWTYTHRADSAELETARFFGANVAETGGKSSSDVVAVKQAILDALADGPLNKNQLEADVRTAMPDARQKQIRQLVDEMTGVTLKVSLGPKNAKVVALA